MVRFPGTRVWWPRAHSNDRRQSPQIREISRSCFRVTAMVTPLSARRRETPWGRGNSVRAKGRGSVRGRGAQRRVRFWGSPYFLFRRLLRTVSESDEVASSAVKVARNALLPTGASGFQECHPLVRWSGAASPTATCASRDRRSAARQPRVRCAVPRAARRPSLDGQRADVSVGSAMMPAPLAYAALICPRGARRQGRLRGPSGRRAKPSTTPCSRALGGEQEPLGLQVVHDRDVVDAADLHALEVSSARGTSATPISDSDCWIPTRNDEGPCCSAGASAKSPLSFAIAGNLFVS